ncbi:TerC family protein [Amphiplicatus metriothermophilus]|uniref:Membrane protein TerC, possibly involved in tellurium resistance n=1 Tax=Amphiplicatus metriothermophilus TaxID=1519374 RepID=A0A239PK17_9PROT|nr:TerC family protein [Amphiplicatus metriothermophilus]MBB5517997.1 putative tellurium resistance membrane protein TerC [Amphiplicatus metriothermophilus]SNT67669.1 Membrane protein TerC, possibly involved in tellurium resistance [Amphiplicatus metriothermophilus]
MADLIAEPAFWGSLATLTFLEIVLGIDNLLFISIAVSKLKDRQHVFARRFGVWGAMILRIAMLGAIFWIVGLDRNALFTLPQGLAAFLAGGDGHAREAIASVTAKDLVLLAGGLFLLWKGTVEVHAAVEGVAHEEAGARSTLGGVLVQLMVINIVFSLDSVITAVGLTNILIVMIAAVVLSTIVMAVSAEPLAAFIEKHPTTKMLALAFILLIGVALVADGAGFHIPRGYLYFAIAFSLAVELLNIRARRKTARPSP